MMSKRELIRRLKQNFDDHVNNVDGVELWFARDLQTLLGYEKWQKFEGVIAKAQVACKQAGNDPADHFTEAARPTAAGKGAQQKKKDYLLTRYACYLAAQNGDSRKQEIAFAMTYFAVQTRKMEVLEQRFGEIERLLERKDLTIQEKLLSKLVYERDVDHGGFGRIRSKGDYAFFGGHSTKQMKARLKTPLSRPLADFLDEIAITGKRLAAQFTNFNIEHKDLHGEYPITREHVENNQEVRDLFLRRGIKPEDLPRAEDIRKVERRVKKDEKKITGKK